jgi:predicted dithiol-disulfide oxidoreductase (DUF899 family)
MNMSLPDVVSQREWLVARKALLLQEKELTRSLDRLNADRRRLPMVRIEKDYRFQGPQGDVSLSDLFEGRRQLIVRHFMFDPAWEDGCPSCTAAVDEMAPGHFEHLAERDTTFAAVSRAPIDKIERYRAKRGWTLPWYSSYGSDFNYDFHVTLDESVAPLEYNYRSREEHQEAGTLGYVDGDQPLERPGLSCFLRVGDDVFHTYSTYARGDDSIVGSAYGLLDLTALGRQEEWEEPKGRADAARSATPDFS